VVVLRLRAILKNVAGVGGDGRLLEPRGRGHGINDLLVRHEIDVVANVAVRARWPLPRQGEEKQDRFHSLARKSQWRSRPWGSSKLGPRCGVLANVSAWQIWACRSDLTGRNSPPFLVNLHAKLANALAKTFDDVS
jgi:hypothetical protein